MMTKTYVVQIGNSDDKLGQNEWAVFCDQAQLLIQQWGGEIHFSGASYPTAEWQNAAWVFNMRTSFLDALVDGLRGLCAQFRQDSIALTEGTTSFIQKGV